MKINCSFHALTAQQIAVFVTFAPIIERIFPAASAHADCLDNKVSFNCGFYEKIAPNKTVFHQPNEEQLYELCDYFNSLAIKQNSKIKFEIWCYDYGDPIPSEIVATW